MNAQPTTQRVKNHHQRMKEKGLKQVRVWIPLGKENVLKDVAEAMRAGKKVVIHDENAK